MTNKPRYWLITVVIILAILAAFLHYSFVPKGFDWVQSYRPATQKILSGKSPYNDLGTGGEFWNPPWVLIFFIPLALLPAELSATIFFFIGLVSYLILAKRFKAGIATLLLFLFSLPVMADLATGNIAWLTMLGYILPPQIGLFFVLLKPQIGGFVAVYWFIEAWREGGIKKVIYTFLPVTIGFALSFIIFGFWILKLPSVVYTGANIQIFPYSIPLGLLIITRALQKREIKYAYMASPFLVPYTAINSFGTVIIGMVNSTWDTLATTLGLWIMNWLLIIRYR